MASTDSQPNTGREGGQASLVLTSFQQLWIAEVAKSPDDPILYVMFYHVSADECAYYGQLFKPKLEIALDEYRAALERVPDEEAFPEIPSHSQLTIAPASLDCDAVFTKRPGLKNFDIWKGTRTCAQEVLNETLIMEKIAKSPHENIVTYHGCITARGRITGIVLERFDKNLAEYALANTLEHLDKSAFLQAMEAAVQHLHALGLAHNDINPHNIMVRNNMPVLVDFGSCQPFGAKLQSLGTPGWCKEDFTTSESEHDVYSLGVLRTWLDDQK